MKSATALSAAIIIPSALTFTQADEIDGDPELISPVDTLVGNQGAVTIQEYVREHHYYENPNTNQNGSSGNEKDPELFGVEVGYGVNLESGFSGSLDYLAISHNDEESYSFSNLKGWHSRTMLAEDLVNGKINVFGQELGSAGKGTFGLPLNDVSLGSFGNAGDIFGGDQFVSIFYTGDSEHEVLVEENDHDLIDISEDEFGDLPFRRDVGIFGSHFVALDPSGQVIDASLLQTSVVPEPSSALGLGLLLSLGFMTRRRSK